MKKYLGMVLTVIVAVTAAILSFILGGQTLSQNQLETLMILGIICGSSALYCFVVGEITLNNSQMDKLWSILPIAYIWVIAARGGMSPRLIVMAVLVTLWGIRLTINFGRKGAYSIKFWTGEEDYRWVVLRRNPILKGRFRWALFDLFFISIYQNALVLAICLPALAVMDSPAAFGVMDYVAGGLVLFFIILETIADEQQMRFHTKKKAMLKEGKKLEELPAPYNKGFNTTGLWSRARHPNYMSEQAIWLCLSLFTIGAEVTNLVMFNWSWVGSWILVLLFLGSAAFGESVSSSKYPEYKNYIEKVSKFIPLRKYKD